MSNEIRFNNLYDPLLGEITREGTNVRVSEDSVAYGIATYLMIGAVFVFDAALSGMTWDAIKAVVMPPLRSLLRHLRKEDQLTVYIEDAADRYEVSIPGDFSTVEIDIPEKLKIRLQK